MQTSRGIIAITSLLPQVSVDAAAALLQRLRHFHDLPAFVPEVSAEAAAAVARRSLPLVHLPAPLAQELEAALAEQRLAPREARRLVQQLTEKLKALSHSPQRGGVGPLWVARSTSAAAAAGVDSRRDRLRGAELAAAREAFEAGELPHMDERAVNAVLGLPPPLRVDQRHAPQLQKLMPTYKTEAEALAFALTRLLPDFAVCVRVLEEAARMMWATGAAAAGASLNGAGTAGWRPREVLVHGAGVGAAVVAVLETLGHRYPASSVVAVESSPLRQLLGGRLERAHREGGRRQGLAEAAEVEREQQQEPGLQQSQYAQRKERGTRQVQEQQQHQHQHHHHQRPGGFQEPANPRISWVRSLAPLSKAKGAQRRRYDLVIAPYQLTLLATAEERQQLVRQLWERCAGVLVLVEPGTPRGFENVAEARQLILGLEGRKRAQLELAAAGSGRSGPGGAADPRVMDKLRTAGAHVVAPCPHDGACPMQATGRNWCHFGQSLRRPPFLQQLVMASATGGSRGAPNELEERFSYVVLRRGPRPQLRVAVAREQGNDLRHRRHAGGVDADATVAAREALMSPRLPERLPPRVVLNQVLLNRAAATAAAAAAPAAAPTLGAATQSVGTVDGDPEVPLPLLSLPPPQPAMAAAAAELPNPRRPPLFGRAGPSSPLESAPAEAAATASTAAPAVAAAAASASARAAAAVPLAAGPVISAFMSKYPAFGPGLVGRLLALQDTGTDWAAAAADDRDRGDSSAGSSGRRSPLAADASGRQRNLPQDSSKDPRSGSSLKAKPVAGSDPDAGSESGPVPDRGSWRPLPLHSLGLNTAVAELSLSLTGLGMAASEPVKTDAGVVADMYGVAPGSHLRGGRVAEDEATSPPLSYSASEELLYSVGARWGAALRRDDVSDEEYDMAERQLMERIYGMPYNDVVTEGGIGITDAYDAAVESGDAAGGASATIGAANEEDDCGTHDVEEEEEEEEAADAVPADDLLAAEAASYGWGRLVRPPRRRGGHVLLDLCVGPPHHYPDGHTTHGMAIPTPYDCSSDERRHTPAADTSPGITGNGSTPGPAAGNAASADVVGSGSGSGSISSGFGVGGSHGADPQDGAVAAVAAAEGVEGDGGDVGGADADEEAGKGRLVQQVVAKSARRSWMGFPAYRLARRLGWGDVWPDWYIRQHNTRESTAKPAKPPPGAGY